ncbi:MAG TPA: outer membrane beta-barrel protein [Burkholderiales bacterium]|nr:outer membrane beta-barrel protein [Burkholderiales bacterium]
MQKKVLAAAVVAAFAAVPTLVMAQAKGGNSDLGFYAGASVGQSSSDCGALSGCDDKDTAYRIFGGYKFHPNIAVEGGYSPLGSIEGSGIKAESNAWDVVGVGSWPLGNNFSIFGKLGFYNAEVKLSGNASGKKTTTDLTYGVGGQYDFNRNLGLRLEWSRYSGVKAPDVGGTSSGDNDIDVVSLGALWRF